VSAHRRWRPYYPHDWDNEDCEQWEVGWWHNWEFSREALEIRDRVEFFRSGSITGPTYWAAIPDFGWPEWPEHSYLSIPQAERNRRWEALAVNDVRFRELLQPPQLPAGPGRTGRAAAAARYRDQLQALMVARLRVKWTAVETLGLLKEAYGFEVRYSDVTALERAQRKAHRFLAEFIFRTRTQLEHGRWFPPFGGYVIRP
jgi:hypothetical protein